jgi:hypothetical protein
VGATTEISVGFAFPRDTDAIDLSRDSPPFLHMKALIGSWKLRV